jgi:hypothetical protein
MKTLLIIILIAAIAGRATSQEATKDFSTFYNKYQDDAGVKSFEIKCNMGNFLEDDENGKNDELFSRPTRFRIFISEKDNGNYAAKVKYYLSGKNYHDLMISKNNGSTVIFKIKELPDKDLKEIVMTISKPESFVAMSFTGKFTFEEAQKMSSSIKSDNSIDFDL